MIINNNIIIKHKKFNILKLHIKLNFKLALNVIFTFL